MKLKNFIFSAVAVLIAFTACQPDPDSLSLTDDGISAPVAGVEKTFSFTTNVDWSAVSSDPWVSVSPASGTAGEAKITVKVAANDTYEDRSASVVVTAASLSATITVNQGYARVFELNGDSALKLDEKAQTIGFKVKANVTYDVAISAGCDWIAKATKAAPVETAYSFDVAANTGLEARQATITVTPSEGNAVTVTVEQAAAEGAMQITSVAYISNRQGTYDDVNYSVRQHGQYVIDATTAKGSVRLVITSKLQEKPLEGIPAIEYSADAADTYKDSTITLGSKHAYYTKIVEGGVEKEVSDAQIKITKEGKVYTIAALLAPMGATTASAYNFTGELPAIQDESKGLEVSEVSYKGDYYTHFASGADGYYITFHPSREVADVDYVYTISTELYATKGAGKVFPTGTFSLTDGDAKIASKYSNGIYAYPEHSLLQSNYAGYALVSGGKGYYSLAQNEGSTVTISANNDGTYKFEFNLIYGGTPSAEGDVAKTIEFKKVYDKVAVPEMEDNHVPAIEDADYEFTEYDGPNAAYIMFGLGNPYAAETFQPAPIADCKFVSTIGWTGGQFEIQFIVATDVEYVYNKNFGNRYSDAPIAAGTYTYCKYASEAKGKFIANVATSAYKKITNSYTGTAFYIEEGSITLSDTDVKLNLKATTADGTKTINLTGGFPTKVYYCRDYSTNSTRVGYAAWNTAFLYPQTTEPFDPTFGYTW